MLTPTCPRCRRRIPTDDLNVSSDVAFCRSCEKLHRLSDLFSPDAVHDTGIDTERPPAGIRRRFETTGEVRWRASHRSWVAALSILAATLFWNGIVSIFVAFVLTATLSHLGLPIAAWLAEQGMKFDELPGVGAVVFLWLFLSPFIAIGTYLLILSISTLAGRTELVLGPRSGSVFVGVGRWGRTRRFEAADITAVTTTIASGPVQDNQNQLVIALSLRDGSQLQFGSLLPDARRAFLGSVLRNWHSQSRSAPESSPPA